MKAIFGEYPLVMAVLSCSQEWPWPSPVLPETMFDGEMCTSEPVLWLEWLYWQVRKGPPLEEVKDIVQKV